MVTDRTLRARTRLGVQVGVLIDALLSLAQQRKPSDPALAFEALGLRLDVLAEEEPEPVDPTLGVHVVPFASALADNLRLGFVVTGSAPLEEAPVLLFSPSEAEVVAPNLKAFLTVAPADQIARSLSPATWQQLRRLVDSDPEARDAVESHA